MIKVFQLNIINYCLFYNFKIILNNKKKSKVLKNFTNIY